MSETLSTRLAKLEERVEALEGNLPAPKGKPILVIEEGVCGIEPERDSAKCDDASLWRYQKGCKGTACVQKYRSYHREYRERQSD